MASEYRDCTQRCCDPFKTHRKIVLSSLRPLPRLFVETSDPIYNFTQSSKICTNCLKKINKCDEPHKLFRKVESSGSDSSYTSNSSPMWRHSLKWPDKNKEIQRRDDCDFPLKMYTGAETSKETQHISPHIAAHKSFAAPTTIASTLPPLPPLPSVAVPGSGPQDFAHLSTTHKSGLSAHIPTYRVGIHDAPFLLSRHGHSSHSHFSKNTPQDLSAHSTAGAEKAIPMELTPHTSSHYKPLPHIQTVVSQGVNNSPVGTLMSAYQADRLSPYYRVPDSLINLQGPSAVLVSSFGGEVGVSTPHSISQTTSLVHAQSTMSAQNSATNLTTMPGVSLAASVSLPGGMSPAVNTTVSQSSLLPTDCVATPTVSSACAVSQAEVKKKRNEHLEQLKMSTGQGGDGSQQTVGPHRDLVRQALQAVVTHPQHKTGNDQEVIEYNYTAGDIAELLMMNIQVNASLQAMNKNTVPPEPGTGQVLLLQPAAVDDTNCLQPQLTSPKQRRRSRLTDEAQVERRIRIALRMREKRAEESEEQKRLRRIREAERMRHKRATEDDIQKIRRRQDAAVRARNRRASMSPEERVIDRQKAADRMRLRRATESDDQKVIRRLKAAERMRKRRASETPEQRSLRRQNIALRMKARRRRKDEESLNVPSSLGMGGSIALLHVDPSIPSLSLGHGPSGISTVDMTQLTHPLPLHKNIPSTQEQNMSHPLSLHKHPLVSQISPATPTSVSTSLATLSTSSHSHLQPVSLHKAPNYHNLPQLLHYHQHHTSSHQHQHNPQQHLQQRHHQQ
ncbi:uncharacterized protein LOC121878482 isoform X2 [Homarus americanus]|uniref:uncharacterized protein LOC121878482 isoform X2 n=1 Tax=Homarus americanus TaxID=6706 RepID=UPI001C46E4C6|nr:uncharacterized protein LOC121878482 isoform X2 [Homarus americanus]